MTRVTFSLNRGRKSLFFSSKIAIINYRLRIGNFFHGLTSQSGLVITFLADEQRARGRSLKGSRGDS